MKSVIKSEYNIFIKGIRKKTICQFSDVHLSVWDELSTEEEKRDAITQSENWERGRKGFALEHGESYEPFQLTDSLTHYNNLIELAKTADIAVTTGDIMDYNSGANIRAMENGLRKLTIPFISAIGNHEDPESIPDGMLISAMKKPIHTLNLRDIQIVSIDNSQRKVTKEQLSELKRILETGKHTVIAMHIPIMTEGNRKKLMNSGEYFQFNYEGCPKENLELISMITDTKYNVVAVLTGHLHYGNVSEIANGIYQYGSSQGILGNANLITIGE